MMPKLGRIGQLSVVAVAIAAATYASSTRSQAQAPAPSPQAAPAKPEPVKGVAIRGCLTGTKLTHIDPPEGSLTLPDTLKVTTIRVIRDQVKALNGHQVELIGALRGIPGQETGVLISDSDKAKVYVGGGDKNGGQDLTVSRNEPRTIHAHTIRDLAPTCAAKPAK